MGKIIWIDTETTGLYSNRNAIIELAVIIDINGSIASEFTIQFKPHDGAKIEPRALEINGRTEEEIDSFPELQFGIIKFKQKMKSYVNKFDPKDKFIAAGYNILFDLGFIREAFTRAGDKFGIGSWCFNCPIDVWSSIGRYMVMNELQLPNFKLETMCNHFKIELNAHNPMSDITATRELFYRIEEELSNGRRHDLAAQNG